ACPATYTLSLPTLFRSQGAVQAAPNSAAAAGAAIVLGLALSRAQRFAEAVEVLDRASSSLDFRHSELALRLEAAAVVAGMNDPRSEEHTSELQSPDHLV